MFIIREMGPIRDIIKYTRTLNKSIMGFPGKLVWNLLKAVFSVLVKSHKEMLDLVDKRADPDGDYCWIGHYIDHYTEFNFFWLK